MGRRASRGIHKYGGLNMTLQEKIKKEAEGYGKLAPVFIEGARYW